MEDFVNKIRSDVAAICSHFMTDITAPEAGIGFVHFKIPVGTGDGLTGFAPIILIDPDLVAEAERFITLYFEEAQIVFLGIKIKVLPWTLPDDLGAYLKDLLVTDADFRAEMTAAIMRRSVQ